MKRFVVLPCLLLACGADPVAGERAATSEDELVVCPEGSTVDGIDVSYFQGTVDWDQVASSGIEFAFARVSDGIGFVDPTFDAHWAGMDDAGLLRGAYQFFRPAQDAVAQADLMIDAIGQLGPGDLPAVLDVEVSNGQSSATIVAKMNTWLDRVEAGTGKRPIIYAASGFWNTLSGTSGFADETLWVANYGVSCPFLPNTWDTWAFWQFTDSGQVPGIAGPVDVNVFNGSLSQLNALADGGSDASVAIEVYWARQADGRYELRALAPPVVDNVVYRVDDWDIGAATRVDGNNFPTSYVFSQASSERQFEVLGFADDGTPTGRGVGLLDVTPNTGVYVRQLGEALYEIGLERAPSGVAAIEVTADGYPLTDAISGVRRSTRLAVRSSFQQLGPRRFAITTFNADGSPRGTLRRDFALE